MLIINQVLPSLLLCTGCGAFLICLGLWYAYSDEIKSRFYKIKNRKSASWTGKTPAQGYSEMIDAVVNANTHDELAKVHPMMNEFRKTFTGKIPELDIIHYINDVADEISNRCGEILLENIRRQLTQQKQKKISTV